MTEREALDRMIGERAISAKLDLILRANRDKRLARSTLDILSALVSELTFQTFAPIKHAALARHVRLHRNMVARSLGLLGRLGYLERDDAALDGRLSRYRLIPMRSSAKQDRPAA